MNKSDCKINSSVFRYVVPFKYGLTFEEAFKCIDDKKDNWKRKNIKDIKAEVDLFPYLNEEFNFVSNDEEITKEKQGYEWLLKNDKYKDFFHLKRMFLKHDGCLTYSQYLEDYLYCKFEKPELMPKDKDVPLPNDYLIGIENLRNCSEDYLCFWIMEMVENVICYAIRYLEYKEIEHSETDAQVETYEDKYFSILYELYYLEK